MQITKSRRRELRAALTAVVVSTTTCRRCVVVVVQASSSSAAATTTTKRNTFEASLPPYGGASVLATAGAAEEQSQSQRAAAINPNESWRSNEEWWKDPLALFEDEEDDDNERVDPMLFGQYNHDDNDYDDDDVNEEAFSTLPDEESLETLEDLLVPSLSEPSVTPKPEVSKTLPKDELDFVQGIDEDKPAVVHKAVMEAKPKKETAAMVEENLSWVDEKKPGSLSSTTAMVSTGGGGAVALAALGPRLKALLAINPAVIQWVAIAAVGKVFVSFVNPALTRWTENRKDILTRRRSKEEDDETSAEDQDETMKYEEGSEVEEGDQDIMDPVEQTLLEHLEEGEDKNEEEEDDLSVDVEKIEQETDKVQVVQKESSAGLTKNKSMFKPAKTREGGWMQACLAFLPHSGRPSRKQLLEQLQELEEKCDSTQRDKGLLEKDYEVSNYKLKEAEQELNTLKQTNRYLQSQLRDQEEMLERVVSTERRKAREELVRMKDAMVQVVDKERDAMREEFLKQAAELQSMWKLKAAKQSQGRTT